MKIFRKLSVGALALVLALSGSLSVTTQTANAFSGAGGGVSGNPYVITTCAQLQEMKDDLAGAYKLGNDIDCDVAPYNTGSGFEPVGTLGTPFTGSLEGAGYTIDGLFINRGGANQVGLFGAADNGASISNVGLVDADVTGGNAVGSLVGYLIGCTVQGSYATGSVGGDSNLGGLVGYDGFGSTVKASYAAVNVSSTGVSGDSGGLVGLLASGAIENSYSTGNVHGANDNVYGGGLVGLASAGTIKNSYATGSVTVASAGNSFAGGLVGVASFSATVSNSYATGTPSAVEGSTHEGGLIGTNGGTFTNSYSVLPSPVGSGSSTGMTGGQSLSSFYQTDPLLGVYTGTPPWDFNGTWKFINASSLPVLDLVEPPTPEDNTAVLSNAVTGQPISLTTPAGTTITCSSVLKDSDAAKRDSGYLYPDGLVKFCFNTSASSNQVNLVFVTSLAPSQVVARKYNSVTQTYATISDASITAMTYNGQAALSVTYTIIDNGPLDENPTLGAITDPVGLAVAYSGVPETGLPQQNIAPFVIAIMGGMILGLSRFPAVRRRVHGILQK